MLLLATDVGELLEPLRQISSAINRNWPPTSMSDWVSFTTSVLAVGAIIVAIASAMFARSAAKQMAEQLMQMKNQHGVEVYFFISKLLGDEELREHRQLVYHKRRNLLKEWSESDEKKARRVVAAFETAFTVTEKAAWAREKLIRNWGQQIVKAYDSTKLLIGKWREEEGASELFREFVDLGRMATEAEERRCSKCAA